MNYEHIKISLTDYYYVRRRRNPMECSLGSNSVHLHVFVRMDQFLNGWESRMDFEFEFEFEIDKLWESLEWKAKELSARRAVEL